MTLPTVFVGVIPGKNNLAGKPFRTDTGGSYQTNLSSCVYQCEINGGLTRYFFVEERYWFDYPGTDKQSHIGNIKKIHHYNENFNEKQAAANSKSNSNGNIGDIAAVITKILTGGIDQQDSSNGNDNESNSGNRTQDDGSKKLAR